MILSQCCSSSSSCSTSSLCISCPEVSSRTPGQGGRAGPEGAAGCGLEPSGGDGPLPDLAWIDCTAADWTEFLGTVLVAGFGVGRGVLAAGFGIEIGVLAAGFGVGRGVLAAGFGVGGFLGSDGGGAELADLPWTRGFTDLAGTVLASDDGTRGLSDGPGTVLTPRPGPAGTLEEMLRLEEMETVVETVVEIVAREEEGAAKTDSGPDRPDRRLLRRSAPAG